MPRKQLPKPNATPEKGDKAIVPAPPIRVPDPDWHEAFLVSLMEDGNVRAACKAAKVDRTTAYRHRETDKAFADQWDAAKKIGLESLRDVANERARRGSDVLLIFLLKAHDPAYRETVNQNHSGEVTMTWRQMVESARKDADDLAAAAATEPEVVE